MATKEIANDVDVSATVPRDLIGSVPDYSDSSFNLHSSLVQLLHRFAQDERGF